MHPFPPVHQLPRFPGMMIYSVGFGPYQLDLWFGALPATPGCSQAKICVEHKVEHKEADGTVWIYDCQAQERPPTVLHRLCSKEITSLDRTDTSLVFNLSDGSALTVLTELDGNESGQIMWDDHYCVF